MAAPSSDAQIGWKLIGIKLTMTSGAIINLTPNLASFTYYEDLERICPTAVAVLNDLGSTDLPLAGGEEFVITLHSRSQNSKTSLQELPSLQLT